MNEPEGLTAVLLQLSGIAQQLADLDHRQAAQAAEIRTRVSALATVVNDLKASVASHEEALTAVEALGKRVGDLAAALGEPGSPGPGGLAGYQPLPAPPLWKLDGAGREEAIARLRAWVEQVYRPGYGHLAASLGPCWEQHPLCVYVLDWLSELWSVLYLQPSRSAATLAGQAEWHTRLLAAASGQLADETRGCAHARTWQRIPTRPEARS